jgi:hypothetical protein
LANIFFALSSAESAGLLDEQAPNISYIAYKTKQCQTVTKTSIEKLNIKYEVLDCTELMYIL